MKIKDLTRSLRRHHLARLKKYRQFYWGRRMVDDPRALGQVATTPTSHQGWLDGNPRRYCRELALDERSAVESFVRIESAELLTI